ncbi:MAG: diphthine synthase, partial [Methanobacteriota archaeon]
MLIFIGLGLNDEKDITQRGIEAAKKSEEIFVELYTSPMPNINIQRLEDTIGKKIRVLSREDLEEKSKTLLELARRCVVAILTPGDPMVATTHLALRLQAEQMGIKTRVIHGPSIVSAAPSFAGLHVYRFGPPTTIPHPSPSYRPTSFYNTITQNQARGLHTLLLLDVNHEKKCYMTIPQAIEQLLEIDKEKILENRILVGIARVGSNKPELR